MRHPRNLISVLLLFIAAMARGQTPPCTNFDDNTLDGWTAQNSNATIKTDGRDTPYADIGDLNGPSNFIAPAQFQGNWLTHFGGCGQLCFDINVIDDGLPTSSAQPNFTITDSSNHSAQFHTNGIVEGSGWKTACAPIGPLDGNGKLPSNGQGTWVLLPGTTLANWQALITNVAKFQFAVDFAGAAAITEHIELDNICFRPATCPKPDFTVKNICAGDQAAYVNASVGATSNNWTFAGGNPTSSTAAAPAVTYANAGTFTTKLCINGATSGPLCVTKNIVVNPRPAVPTITGPTSACQKPTTYCVAAQPGVTFAWSIVPPTAGTITATTATCATVNWNASGGVIVVTATNVQGCKSTARLEATCPISPCCDNPPFKVISGSLVNVGGGWQFRPVISAPSARRVLIDIIRASTTKTSGTCASVPAFAPTVTAINPTIPATPLAPTVAIPGSFEGIWQGPPSPPTPLANVTFPLTVQIPGLSLLTCSDTVNLCVKYTVTDGECRTCERIECYSFPRGTNPNNPR